MTPPPRRRANTLHHPPYLHTIFGLHICGKLECHRGASLLATKSLRPCCPQIKAAGIPADPRLSKFEKGSVPYALMKIVTESDFISEVPPSPQPYS